MASRFTGNSAFFSNFVQRSHNKITKARYWPECRNLSMTVGFPSQKVSNAEIVSVTWRNPLGSTRDSPSTYSFFIFEDVGSTTAILLIGWIIDMDLIVWWADVLGVTNLLHVACQLLHVTCLYICWYISFWLFHAASWLLGAACSLLPVVLI